MIPEWHILIKGKYPFDFNLPLEDYNPSYFAFNLPLEDYNPPCFAFNLPLEDYNPPYFAFNLPLEDYNPPCFAFNLHLLDCKLAFCVRRRNPTLRTTVIPSRKNFGTTLAPCASAVCERSDKPENAQKCVRSAIKSKDPKGYL